MAEPVRREMHKCNKAGWPLYTLLSRMVEGFLTSSPDDSKWLISSLDFFNLGRKSPRYELNKLCGPEAGLGCSTYTVSTPSQLKFKTDRAQMHSQQNREWEHRVSKGLRITGRPTYLPAWPHGVTYKNTVTFQITWGAFA
jgi:hypothetical protein